MARWCSLSVGMSNTTQEYQAFLRLSRGDPSLHRRLVLVDGAQGGQTAADIRRPDASFWQVVDRRLHAAGATGRQVQAIWLKEAQPPAHRPLPWARSRRSRRTWRQWWGWWRNDFPNVQLVYLSSRIYAGYASSSLNPEPFAYESGFSVRWLIERQLRAEPALNADPALGPVKAPVLLWGPYLWADGLVARRDGLSWRCEDFAADGTHPSASGQEKVAALLMRFLHGEDSARGWFLADPNAPTPTVGPDVHRATYRAARKRHAISSYVGLGHRDAAAQQHAGATQELPSARDTQPRRPVDQHHRAGRAGSAACRVPAAAGVGVWRHRGRSGRAVGLSLQAGTHERRRGAPTLPGDPPSAPLPRIRPVPPQTAIPCASWWTASLAGGGTAGLRCPSTTPTVVPHGLRAGGCCCRGRIASGREDFGRWRWW